MVSVCLSSHVLSALVLPILVTLLYHDTCTLGRVDNGNKEADLFRHQSRKATSEPP
jgi:hypothetical protein